MNYRGWMKLRMIVYFFLGVLIGLGYPVWAQLFEGGFDHVHRGMLWGLVTLTLALALISMSLRLRERLQGFASARISRRTAPSNRAYPASSATSLEASRRRARNLRG